MMYVACMMYECMPVGDVSAAVTDQLFTAWLSLATTPPSHTYNTACINMACYLFDTSTHTSNKSNNNNGNNNNNSSSSKTVTSKRKTKKVADDTNNSNNNNYSSGSEVRVERIMVAPGKLVILVE